MPNPNPTPQPYPAPKPFAPAPGFSTLEQYIQAAAASVNTSSIPCVPSDSSVPSSAPFPSAAPDSPFSNLSALYHLAVAIFTAARAATRCLLEHYNARPHALTPELQARLTYCANRLKAIFHTLCHAPARFLAAGQFRALYNAQAVLAHIWRQSVNFGPLIPWLTAPENCPAPARVKPDPSLRACRSALRASSDPLLLQNPGRALTAVLNQLSAIYGIAPKPVAPPRSPAPDSASEAAGGANPDFPPPAQPSEPSNTVPREDLSPPSALRVPSYPHPPP